MRGLPTIRSHRDSSTSKPDDHPMRLLVVDDHQLFLDGLKSLLARWRTPLQIDEATRLAEARLQLRRQPRYDLVLLDLMLPDVLNPWETLRQLLPETAGAPVVAMSMTASAELPAEAIRAGARGFIHKTDRAELMLSVLDVVLAGGSCLPPQPVTPNTAAEVPVLSERQREVVALLARGLSNKEISRELDIAETTVKVHVHRILQLLGIDSRTKVAAWAHATAFTAQGRSSLP